MKTFSLTSRFSSFKIVHIANIVKIKQPIKYKLRNIIINPEKAYMSYFLY